MKNLFILSSLLFSFHFMSAQNYTWSSVANCPEALYAPASFTIGNNMYVVSGGTSVASSPKILSQHVWQYNTATNTWTQKNDFPGSAVYEARGFTIAGLGYVCNGWGPTGSTPSALWCYDPASDTWTSKAPFPGSGRYTTATFTLNNKAYVTLGYSPYMTDMFEYDPATNAWTQKASYPGAGRQAPIWFTIGNYAYVCMGVTGAGGYLTYSDNYKYDPSNNTWTRLNDFPSIPLSSSAAFVVNNEAYVINGLTQNNQTYGVGAAHDVWKYSPVSDSWDNWGVFPGLALFEGAYTSVNGTGYTGLGAGNYTTFPLTNLFWKFGPATAPYSCTSTINKFRINNTTYNYQANGSFSATAQLSWDFGDGTSGSGTSVTHTFSTAGQHIVALMVTDTSGAGCSGSTSDTFSIGHVSTCAVSIQSTHMDSSYTLIPTVTGAGPYSYHWSCLQDTAFSSTTPDPFIGINTSIPTTYCVTVSDTLGCTASTCINLTYTPDSAQCHTYLYIYPDGDQPGLYFGSIYHTGGTPVSYFWSFGDGHTSTDSFPSYTYITAGRYFLCLTITDDSGCVSSYCDSFFYDYKFGGGPMRQLVAHKGAALPLGLNNTKDDAILGLYPNPAHSSIRIDTKGSAIRHICVYNVAGQNVLELNEVIDNTVDIKQLSSGLYSIEVQTGSSIYHARFVKVE